jgi:hypothetical protein
MNSILIIISIIIGTSFGILYNIFIIKGYPDYKRKFGYFITVVIFLLFTASLFGILIMKSGLNSTIRDYSTKLEHYVKINYSENEFVRNGLDMRNINNDISKINNSVNEIKSILPSNKELGVNKFLYDLIVEYAVKELQKRLIVVNYSAKVMNSFSDKDNILTISSLVSGLQQNAIRLINITSFIIIGIIVLFFSIYIIFTLIIVKREHSAVPLLPQSAMEHSTSAETLP